MISPRTHGVIDFAAAALMGAAAARSPLSPRTRRVLGAAGAYHAGYSLLTDYDAGLRALLTMRQHLALDAVGAGALCAAGLLMRGPPRGERALLVAAGVTELAILASSDGAARDGAGRAPDGPAPAYPPLDTPKLVAPDVFVVDSTLPGVKGRVMAARMTVIRLPGGDLVLHSPTRFSHRLKQELERRGRIRHLVAPSFAHWMFLAGWQRHCPDAVTWAAPGLRARSQVRRSHVRLDADLPGAAATAWGDTIRTVTIPGGLGFTEVALFHVPTRTLVLTDLDVNLEPRKLPLPLRPVARLLGLVSPGGTTPRYLRPLLDLTRGAAAQAAERLIALGPERVIVAHGRCIERDGTGALRRSLRWLVSTRSRG